MSVSGRLIETLPSLQKCGKCVGFCLCVFGAVHWQNPCEKKYDSMFCAPAALPIQQAHGGPEPDLPNPLMRLAATALGTSSGSTVALQGFEASTSLGTLTPSTLGSTDVRSG